MANHMGLKVLAGVSAVFVMSGCASVSESSAAVRAEEPPVSTKVAEAGTSAQEKMICKVQSVTGSNLTKKKCATESEWARIREDSKQKTKWMQNTPGSLPRNGVAGG